MGNNIILIGLPGSGKTTVGKLLAKKLEYQFIDMDSLIEEFEGLSIKDIFTQKGEEYFRELETRIIKSFSGIEKKVISTGGGTFEKEENQQLLKNLGKVIYLYTDPETIYERIKNDKGRPLLQTENPLETLKKLFSQREKNYKFADYTIDTTNNNPYNVIDEIIKD